MGKHKFGDWRYLLLNARIKKQFLEKPHRERVLVKKAIISMGLTFREAVVFRNPYWSGWKGKTERAPQWLDFAVFYKKMYVLQFDYRRIGQGAGHSYQKRSHAAKLKFLKEKGIPCLVLKRTYSSQEYELIISTFLRKEA